MHHVVPYQYRRYMDEAIKSRSSHDLLPVCIVCHDKYERHALQFKRHLAECFAAPLEGLGWIERRDIGKGGRAAGTLTLPSLEKIPSARIAQLRAIVEEVVGSNAGLFSDDSQCLISKCRADGSSVCSESTVLRELMAMEVRIQGLGFRTHGEIVVGAVSSHALGDGMCGQCKTLVTDGVPALVMSWRRHFVECARPAHLPDHWSVEYRCTKD
ncbi:hypothetical protein H4S02_008752 [Coemansia sp. RSA 2611]|nr:hypothetical protein H4S02_008752 [Coemansia sp. RSA 2611]